MALKNEMTDKKIIFFDGVCHLCNGFVDFLIRADKKRKFFFAPLQGETSSNLLSAEKRQKLETVIYYDRGVLHEESDAILKIFSDLGGAYRILSLGRLLPRFLRNGVYRWVARHRYGWFGEREFCRLPQPEEKTYLLP
jgi:predicted DCC family thiol-disulfide oxidoreductase YuxK